MMRMPNHTADLTGIYERGGKYRVQVSSNGTVIHGGTFSSLEPALAERDRIRRTFPKGKSGGKIRSNTPKAMWARGYNDKRRGLPPRSDDPKYLQGYNGYGTSGRQPKSWQSGNNDAKKGIPPRSDDPKYLKGYTAFGRRGGKYVPISRTYCDNEVAYIDLGGGKMALIELGRPTVSQGTTMVR